MLYVDPLSSFYAQRFDVGRADGKERVALQELEHYFLYTLLQEMHKTMGRFAGVPQSREVSFYTDLLDDALSGEMAASGQLGIAQQIATQLHAAEIQSKLHLT